jgi:hypothetical protein
MPGLRRIAAFLLQQPADQIVLVPAGQHHHLGRRASKFLARLVLIPLLGPHLQHPTAKSPVGLGSARVSQTDWNHSISFWRWLAELASSGPL